jgi:hypothetical protein
MAMWKMVFTAFVVTAVFFMEIFAGVISQRGEMSVIVVPLVLMPMPLMCLRCCGGGDAFGSGPKWKHCTDAIVAQRAVPSPPLPERLARSLTLRRAPSFCQGPNFGRRSYSRGRSQFQCSSSRQRLRALSRSFLH